MAGDPYWETVNGQIWGMTDEMAERGHVTAAELANFTRTIERCATCRTPFIRFVAPGAVAGPKLCRVCWPWMGRDLPETEITA